MPPAANLVDLSQLTDPQRVVFIPEGTSKKAALEMLIEAAISHPDVTDPVAFASAIHDRERVSSTGIGGGIAVPHAKIGSVNGFIISIGICKSGVDFAAKDEQPVHVFVMIAATDTERDVYLKVLATVASRLKQPDVAQALIAADEPEHALAAFLGA